MFKVLCSIVVSSVLITSLTVTGASADGHENRFSWTGFYLGGHAGGAWSDVDFSDLNFQGLTAPSPTSIPGSLSANADGFFGGGHAGYNFQFGNWIVGGELALSGGDISGSELSSNLTFSGAEDDLYSVEINSIFQIALRFGQTFNNFHVYGKVGYASADVDSNVLDTSDTNPGAPAGSFGATGERHHGFVLGAGLEYALSNQVIVGLDYSYINLEEKTHKAEFFNSGTGTVTSNVFRNVDPDIHALTARISVKLN